MIYDTQSLSPGKYTWKQMNDGCVMYGMVNGWVQIAEKRKGDFYGEVDICAGS